MGIFLTSDTHFGHDKIMVYTSRGDRWANPDEMQDGLIYNWNSVVRPGDHVYHLGDFAWSRGWAEDAFRRLNGHIHLIRGNHDEPAFIKNLAFASVHDIHILHYNHKRIVLCHYPLLTWPNAHKGFLHAHGHSHGNSPIRGGCMDVGIDATADLRPIPIDTVIEICESVPYEPVDHHDQNRRDDRRDNPKIRRS